MKSNMSFLTKKLMFLLVFSILSNFATSDEVQDCISNVHELFYDIDPHQNFNMAMTALSESFLTLDFIAMNVDEIYNHFESQYDVINKIGIEMFSLKHTELLDYLNNVKQWQRILNTYERAKKKCIVAKDTSDLSEVEYKETRKHRAKVNIHSSPSPSPKKLKLAGKKMMTPPKVFRNKNVNSNYKNDDNNSPSVDSFDDSDKDPDFKLKTNSPALSEVEFIYSPIGKIRVETVSDSKMLEKKTMVNKSLQVMADDSVQYSSKSEHVPKLFKRKLFSDSQSTTNSPALSEVEVIYSPIGKIRVETVSDSKILEKKTMVNKSLQVMADDSVQYSPKSEHVPKLFKRKLFSDSQSTSSTIESQPNIDCSVVDYSFFTADLQKNLKSVMTSLTHIRFDISNMASIQQIMSANIETLMGNSNKTFTNTESNFDINEIFPIETINDLHDFELKLKQNENDFKRVLVRKLSLLVTTKSLGDSVRRIISRMFHDNVLQKYSTYGFKQKERFASLQSYHIIIDTLRAHVKYEMIPDKDIDNEIGVWLAHAQFRLKKKIAKTNKNYSI